MIKNITPETKFETEFTLPYDTNTAQGTFFWF